MHKFRIIEHSLYLTGIDSKKTAEMILLKHNLDDTEDTWWEIEEYMDNR